jgi:NTE family protein
VLVFQGGGALGAYQAGVYHALHDAGIEPDWIIGTSIGAINAGLIAGNPAENRLAALQAFWDRMAHRGPWQDLMSRLWMTPPAAYWATLFGGVPGFFAPNLPAFLGAHVPLGVDQAGYYSTEPLRRTLAELIEPGRLEQCTPRLTVGAAEVRTSRMRYFDSRDMPIGIDHIMASGALPPAFPAVRIDGELYWDGGILSNTPTEVIFDDNPRRNSLIFAVHMWNPLGEEPSTIWEVMHRHKDIQYSSRVASHIARQKQAHRLRHIIKELADRLPETARADGAVRDMLDYGCLTRMHVVRLLAPSLDHEDQTKDVDFSDKGIRTRWEAGYAHAQAALERGPWQGEFDPLEGVILHEPPFERDRREPAAPAAGEVGETRRTGTM